MPEPPNAEQDQGPQTLFALFAVGGIALVLVALTWLFPKANSTATPILGKTEERFRATYESLVTASGGTALQEQCQYYGKTLALSCHVPRNLEHRLVEALRSDGWRDESRSSDQFVFTKGRDNAIIMCHSRVGPSICEFSFHLSLSRASDA